MWYWIIMAVLAVGCVIMLTVSFCKHRKEKSGRCVRRKTRKRQI